MEDDLSVEKGEDGHWAERGEFDRQQDGWKMTSGWRRVRMTTGRRGESLIASRMGGR